MEFREHRLENGLEIVAECNPRAISTALGFFVKAGPRDESDEVWGVSHFLEHMVFKGTPTRSSWDVNREMDEMGMHCNAYTSEEQTVYYMIFLPEFQDRAIELLSDIMRPSLRKEDFDVEKDVILKEIHKSDEEPPFGAYEKCMASFFAGHPLGRSILGTLQSVGALTPEAMRAYFERRYSPGNMVLVASGKIDFEQLISEANRLCGHWPPFEVKRELRRAEPRTGLVVEQNNLATQEYIIQATAGPAAEDEDRYPGRLMATIFGDDSGSRVYWDMVQTGLAEYAGTSCHEFQGSGILLSHIFCEPEDAAENLETMVDLQRQFEEEGPSEDELARAKSKICTSIVLASERPGNRLFSIGSNWIQRRHYRRVKEAVEAYQRVGIDDVRTVLEKYPLHQATTVAVGPLAELAVPAVE